MRIDSTAGSGHDSVRVGNARAAELLYQERHVLHSKDSLAGISDPRE